MSNKYSIGGYRIAIQARTSKTVLLEGRDDKELFDCLKLSWLNAEKLNIDTQNILSDGSLAGLGAKARIDYFISQIPPASPIREKFYGFVDREWEELIDPLSLDPLPWSAPTLTDVRLKTPGHSIENFGFNFDFIAAYLRHFGQAVATVDLLDEVRNAVPELLRASAAFSEVARKRQLIGRCMDIIDLGDIDWNGSRVLLNTQVEQKISSRGAQNAAGFIQEFDQEYSGKWSAAPLNDQAHFHAHGHLGEMILWSGIGRIVVNRGFLQAVGDEIARGRRDEKRRVWHNWLSQLAPSSLAPMDQALS